MQIYLDYSSTTPPRQEVVTYINQVCTQGWGNPSSTHQWGKKAYMILERARIQIANSIKANDIESIIFTSGGTDSVNLVASSYADEHLSKGDEIIITTMEHHANIVPWHFLRERKGVQIKWIDCDQNGKFEINQF